MFNSTLNPRALAITLGAVLVAGSPMASVSASAPLRIPFSVDAQTAVAEKDLKRCDPAPQAMRTLATESRYDASDTSRSKIDDKREQAYREAIAPLRDFEEQITHWSNQYVSNHKPGPAGCSLSWLDSWASADALTDAQTSQAIFNRDEAVAALALAYLKLAAVEMPDAQVKPRIAAWLRKLALGSQDFYDHEAGRRSRANNHRYWAGLAVGAAAVAANDADLFAWAMDTFRLGVCSATPDGALPLELERGKRARDYHLFALGPLVMLAELGAHNGIDTYGACDHALDRVVGFSLAAVDDPSRIESLAGEKQVDFPDGKLPGYRVAWLAPYLVRHDMPDWRGRIPALGRLMSTALGGDLGALYAVE